MKFMNYTNPKLLIADEGKKIRDINDVYVAEHKDEEGNIVPEHFPHYSDVIFIAKQIDTLEKCQELYVEEVVK